MNQITKKIIGLLTTAAAILFLSYAASTSFAQQAEVMNVDETMTLTPTGDATVLVKMKMTAREWANWKEKFGNNPSLMKREMNKSMSAYETSNYRLDQNDMEREMTVSLDAKGAVLYKGDGQFEFKVPREWQNGERVGNEYHFSYPQSSGPGQIMQQNPRIVLPAAATNITDQLGEDGEKVVTYRLPVAAGRTNWLVLSLTSLIAAIAAAAISVFPRAASIPTAIAPVTPGELRIAAA